ncbi:hypothetical protein EUTSA_v10015747mg [Eutrema salsugineum]|uniref:F-box domain-containing protein n=1 Tax=Eutrema salsugineum TaxID=72664 RepID=V4LSC9_EUTSA|nr:probable FBD-associated F-box protein At1g32375 [Eutrema salsugineum]ESQ42788.1 hypothetical protein EUTSA_v10015747mg [Eutrema salsugineum]
MDRVDWISELPQELLLRILSLLPAQDVVATMVLSKRWQSLWTFVPRLVYDDSYHHIYRHPRFSRFVDRCLLLHEAPVIENLHFKLGQKSFDVDIGVWARTLVKRCVRELVIEIDCSSSASKPILPRSLYTVSRMLVTLKLEKVILVDFSSSVSFPSLKTLSLVSVMYPGDEFVNSLLSNCPVLEDLNVERCVNENVTIFTIRVPSLKKLVLYTTTTLKVLYTLLNSDTDKGFVIDAPSLEYLDIYDRVDGFIVIESGMPNIVEADLRVDYWCVGKILGYITSVECVDLCWSSLKDVYPVGIVFHRLVDLSLCTLETHWLNLLMCLLRDSPNLRALQLYKLGHYPDRPSPSWKKPSSVPECLLSSLETIEWEDYQGTEEEKELMGFILRSGSCLKKVTISSIPTDSDKKLEMIKELTLSIRLSPTCQIEFS